MPQVDARGRVLWLVAAAVLVLGIVLTLGCAPEQQAPVTSPGVAAAPASAPTFGPAAPVAEPPMPPPTATRPVAGGSPTPAPTATRPTAAVSPVASTTVPAPAPKVVDAVGPATRILGRAEASVTVVEFTDFQCPYCKRYHEDVFPEVIKTYGSKIRYVFRDSPIMTLHPYAAKAAEAARCANDQGKFWEYADALFRDEGELQPAKFPQIAAALGLKPAEFQACLDSGKYAPAVQRDLEDGARLGVTGTPTFFINGRMLVGARPFSQFKEAIDAALGAAGR